MLNAVIDFTSILLSIGHKKSYSLPTIKVILMLFSSIYLRRREIAVNRLSIILSSVLELNSLLGNFEKLEQYLHIMLKYGTVKQIIV